MERLEHLIKFDHEQLVKDVKEYVFPLAIITQKLGILSGQ
jgi:hypothetical protein